LKSTCPTPYGVPHVPANARPSVASGACSKANAIRLKVIHSPEIASATTSAG